MAKPQNHDDPEDPTNNKLLEPNLGAYIFFLIGQLISLLGSSIIQFVIIFWIAIETGNEFILGLAAFLGFGTTIALTPIAGVYVDRWSRKKIIGIVDFLQALATMVLIYLFMTGIVEIWHVLIILTLRGAFEGFHEPAIEAIVPLLVPRDKLSRINGLTYLMNGIVFIVGPVVAAVLYMMWEIHKILWIDAITFLIAVIPLLFIKIPSVRRKQTEVEEKPSFKKEFKEGVVFIKEKKGLISLLSVFAIVNFFAVPLFVLLPLLVTKVHDGGAYHLAFLMAFQQGGMILGGLFMSVWKGFKRNVVGVAGGMFFAYVGILVVALAPKGNFWVMGAGIFLLGLVLPIINVSSQTIWQQIIPPAIIGRVFSVRRTVAQATGPISMILSGFLAYLFGIINLLIASALIGLVLLLYSWFMTDLPTVDEILLTSDTALQTLTEEQIETIEGETLPPEFI